MKHLGWRVVGTTIYGGQRTIWTKAVEIEAARDEALARLDPCYTYIEIMDGNRRIYTTERPQAQRES